MSLQCASWAETSFEVFQCSFVSMSQKVSWLPIVSCVVGSMTSSSVGAFSKIPAVIVSTVVCSLARLKYSASHSRRAG